MTSSPILSSAEDTSEDEITARLKQKLMKHAAAKQLILDKAEESSDEDEQKKKRKVKKKRAPSLSSDDEQEEEKPKRKRGKKSKKKDSEDEDEMPKKKSKKKAEDSEDEDEQYWYQPTAIHNNTPAAGIKLKYRTSSTSAMTKRFGNKGQVHVPIPLTDRVPKNYWLSLCQKLEGEDKKIVWHCPYPTCVTSNVNRSGLQQHLRQVHNDNPVEGRYAFMCQRLHFNPTFGMVKVSNMTLKMKLGGDLMIGLEMCYTDFKKNIIEALARVD